MSDEHNLQNRAVTDGVSVFGIENHAISKAVCIGFNVTDPDAASYSFLTPEYAIQIGEAMIREAQATINGERFKSVPRDTSN